MRNFQYCQEYEAVYILCHHIIEGNFFFQVSLQLYIMWRTDSCFGNFEKFSWLVDRYNGVRLGFPTKINDQRTRTNISSTARVPSYVPSLSYNCTSGPGQGAARGNGRIEDRQMNYKIQKIFFLFLSVLSNQTKKSNVWNPNKEQRYRESKMHMEITVVGSRCLIPSWIFCSESSPSSSCQACRFSDTTSSSTAMMSTSCL